MRSIIQFWLACIPTLIFGTHARYLRLLRQEMATSRSEIQTMHAAAADSDARHSRIVTKLQALVDGERK